MTIQTLKAPTFEDAIELLKKAVNNEFDDSKSYELQFGDWLRFSLDVKGERYSSSLPSSSLRAVSQYQAAINSFYALLAYGKTAQSLTDEDKKELELIFEFSEGSTKADADLTETITTLGMAAIEKMDGNQLVITILVSAIILGIYLGYTNFLANDTERRKDDVNMQIVQSALESNVALARLNAEIADSAIGLAKSVSDADSVQLGSLELSGSEIGNYIKRERGKRRHKRINGAFRATRISEADNGFRVRLADKHGSALIATLSMDGAHSTGILASLLESVADKKLVELSIMVKMHGTVIDDASILSGPVQNALAVDIDDDSEE